MHPNWSQPRLNRSLPSKHHHLSKRSDDSPFSWIATKSPSWLKRKKNRAADKRAAASRRVNRKAR